MLSCVWGGGRRVGIVMSGSKAQPPQAEGPDTLPPENNDLGLSLVWLFTIRLPNLIPIFKCS